MFIRGKGILPMHNNSDKEELERGGLCCATLIMPEEAGTIQEQGTIICLLGTVEHVNEAQCWQAMVLFMQSFLHT